MTTVELRQGYAALRALISGRSLLSPDFTLLREAARILADEILIRETST